jgi:hypothetical protein
MVLELTRGKDKGLAWRIETVSSGHAYATNTDDDVRQFNEKHSKLFDVCVERTLQIGIGDQLFSRSGNRKGKVTNGERVTVTGWDERGNPVSFDGRSITHLNLCHAYASTVRKVQGASKVKVIVGYDRHSIKYATQDAAYVATGRGRQFCDVYVENISDLSQIQNRNGNRKAATEMTIKGDLPSELRAIAERIEQARSGQQQQTIDKVDLKPGKQVQLSPLELIMFQMAQASRTKNHSHTPDPEPPHRTQDREITR